MSDESDIDISPAPALSSAEGACEKTKESSHWRWLKFSKWKRQKITFHLVAKGLPSYARIFKAVFHPKCYIFFLLLPIF